MRKHFQEPGSISVLRSESTSDEHWDDFLESVPQGEYAQSSMWAAYKQIDGWRCSRLVLADGENILGGFQILWKAVKYTNIRIGYISRGPVLKDEEDEAVQLVVSLLLEEAKRLRLSAIIVQAPAFSRLISEALVRRRFVVDQLMKIINATLVIDFGEGMAGVEKRMRRTTRQEIRRGIRSDVQIRTGTEDDIGLFFQLMARTCKRQKTRPNPSSEAALRKLWQTLSMRGNCRLTIAEQYGEPLSALFCILFGKIMTLWKKGANPEKLHLHSVGVLYRESFQWAYSNGFQLCDFAAVDRRIADPLTRNQAIPEDLKKSIDVFNLGFGGRPVLLPEAYVHVTNPLAFALYRFIAPILLFGRKHLQ